MDLQTLNCEQRRAVEATEGPVLILAGAGSGKTRALTHRVAYLIEEKGVSPYEILALTFTNKAAREMRERVEELVGENGTKVWISTFHSACARILRMEIEHLGQFTRDFVIYDPQDQLQLIVEIQKQMQVSEEVLPKRILKAVFSEAKNRSVNPFEYIQTNGQLKADQQAEAYKLYDQQMRKNNALDFDDLLLRTLELFSKNPDILEKYQSRFRYIHIDEYQDTNQPQYRLVEALSKKYRNLCVVGDDDQSIYGWRGADISNILGFEKDFPDAVVIRLEQNYRSTKTILSAANEVIKQNYGRKSKTLWTEHGEGEKINVYEAYSERDEADYVCRQINQLSSEREYSDFAVLYRTNAQTRILEDTFVAYGIPYTVYGSMSFYERKEIKDVIAYLRLMLNPNDEVSLRRVINTPKRGIGDASVTELERIANEKEMRIFDACLQAEELPLSARVKSKIRKFGEVLAQLRALCDMMPLKDFVPEMLELIGYWNYLEESKKTDRKEEQRKENVQEFLNAINAYAADNPEDTLRGFLENIALVANVKDETDGVQVTLMTLHSAKGLEFPVVYIVGMEEGLFPSMRSTNTESGMEEERRLCYVGLTRAMEELNLSYSRSRMQYDRLVHNPPSRFLDEIPDALVTEIENGRSNDRSGQAPGDAVPREVLVGKPGLAPRFGRSTTTISKESMLLGASNYAKTSPDAAKTEKKYDFSVYQQVKHAKFGMGQITGMESGVLTIEFKDVGEKKIAAAFAPLQPADED